MDELEEFQRIKVLVETAERSFTGYIYKPRQGEGYRLSDYLNHYPDKFLPLIRSGKIDVIMVAMNFVDRHTYAFETKVLPAAREQEMGIVCMKVYGGMQGGFAAASGPNTGPMIQSKMKQLAVRYALGLPGVASCVIGPHTLEQLRENAQLVQDYQPLSEGEFTELMAEGKRLASIWKDHFGPVV